MSVSKRTRFEVFKRDSFTCQYCGAKAPDVLLHVDHIEPRAKGGTDDILNLVTACAGCNGGKSDKKLSDKSAMAKRHGQLAELQKRQEQMQMMLDWQRTLIDMDEQAVTGIAELWEELAPGVSLNENGRQGLKKLIRKYGAEEVAEVVRIAAEQYLAFSAEGTVSLESANAAFSKIGRICNVRHAEKDKPYLQDLFYIRGIIRNRLSYCDEHRAKEILEDAFRAGADAEELKAIARSVRHWTGWKEEMFELIEAYGRGGDDA